jgi:hypothetical protein
VLDSLDFQTIIERLRGSGIPYAITGSVAVIVYGAPRMTHDIDLVIALDRHDITVLLTAFPEEEFYVPPRDVVLAECSRSARGHFNIIHHETGFKADFYPTCHDSFQKWAVQHAREVDLFGGVARVAPPEYVMIKKLEYFREGGSVKHLSDIASILEYSGDEIDHTLLATFIRKAGVDAEWKQALAACSACEGR